MIKIERGNEEDRAFIRGNLIMFNQQKLPEHRDTPYGAVTYVVKDEHHHILGGITAHFNWERMQIDFLWVDEQVRQKGLGKELLEKVEHDAIEKGCTLLIVDTFSFQAPDFYISNGFTVFGKIENHPTGHHQYFLQKRIGD